MFLNFEKSIRINGRFVLLAARTATMDVLRPVLLANACVALFLCVDEQYQPLVTVAITIGVLARTYMGRGHMAALQPKEA